MTIMLIAIASIAVLLFAGAICTVFKAGEKEDICKYAYDDKEEK